MNTWHNTLTETHHLLTTIITHHHRALTNALDMLPGLQATNLQPRTINIAHSPVEQHALNPTPQRHIYNQLHQLPIHAAIAANQTARIHTPIPHQPTPALHHTQTTITHILKQPKPPPQRPLTTLLRTIWTLDELVHKWANTPKRQAELRGNNLTNDDIWCLNCRQQAGHKNPRSGTGETNCHFCADFRRTYDLLPDRELLDAHSRRRLNEQDIQRCLDRAGSKKKAKLTTRTDT